MKNYFLIFLFFLSSCSSFEPVDLYKKNPKYQEAYKSFLNRCQRDVANGKFLIKFERSYQNIEFCVCLNAEFKTTINGNKITQNNYDQWMEEFNENPDAWMIHDFETQKEKYFDLYTSIQNQNKHSSWKNRYQRLYEEDVKKCVLKSKYAQDRWSGLFGLSKTKIML